MFLIKTRKTAESYKKECNERMKLHKAHAEGKLSSEWYSVDKRGNKYLSPKKIKRML